MADLEKQGLGKLKQIIDTYVGTLTTKHGDSGQLVKIPKKFKDIKELIAHIKHRKDMGDEKYEGLRIAFMLKWLQKGEQKNTETILNQLNLNGGEDKIIITK